MWKCNSGFKKFRPCLIRGVRCRCAHTYIVGMLRLCLYVKLYDANGMKIKVIGKTPMNFSVGGIPTSAHLVVTNRIFVRHGLYAC